MKWLQELHFAPYASQESTGQQLLEAVDASFDLFDESTRNALAIKAAAEQHTNDGGKGFLALAAAVKVATERHMEACGERLRKMIAVSRGDAKMLRSLAESYARKGQIDNAFLAVVDANLEVARTRNEPVKVKVLTYLRDEVLTPLLRGEPLSMAQGHDASASGTGLPARGADASMEERLGRHHAPQFTPTDRDEAATTSETDVAEAPIRFLNCSSLADALAVSSKGGTKGAKKRAAKEKAARMAQEIGRSLGEEGWAVMDEFLSLDDIRGVRAGEGAIVVRIVILKSNPKENRVARPGGTPPMCLVECACDRSRTTRLSSAQCWWVDWGRHGPRSSGRVVLVLSQRWLSWTRITGRVRYGSERRRALVRRYRSLP